MAGLTLLCVVLGALALALAARLHVQRQRISRMTVQAERFLTRGGAPMEVALRENALAQLQNAVAELEVRLLQAQEQQKEECMRTSHLTADISHQLKTPLASLRLYAELDGAPHMEQTLEQIGRMEYLIASLLKLERLCADGYAFHFAPHEVRDVVEGQWEGLHAIWPDRHLTVEGTCRIRCDERWLGEAFLNLLKNACEHTSPGGHIRVRMERTDSAFFCTVEDDGGGVKKEELPRLFERFYRAEHQSTEGAGIGLNIVREIIQRHHGTIVAENGEKGLRMTITLPMLDNKLNMAEE